MKKNIHNKPNNICRTKMSHDECFTKRQKKIIDDHKRTGPCQKSISINLPPKITSQPKLTLKSIYESKLKLPLNRKVVIKYY